MHKNQGWVQAWLVLIMIILTRLWHTLVCLRTRYVAAWLGWITAPTDSCERWGWGGLIKYVCWLVQETDQT